MLSISSVGQVIWKILAKLAVLRLGHQFGLGWYKKLIYKNWFLIQTTQHQFDWLPEECIMEKKL